MSKPLKHIFDGSADFETSSRLDSEATAREGYVITDAYKHALAALKAQASAAMLLLEDKAAGTSAMQTAHRDMIKYDVECQTIVRLVMGCLEPDITIETLTDEKLAEMLGFRQ